MLCIMWVFFNSLILFICHTIGITALTWNKRKKISFIIPILPQIKLFSVLIIQFSFLFLNNAIFFFVFLGSHLQHMEVPALEVKSELQLPAYAIARAMMYQSLIWDLCHSLWHCQILNLLSKTRDQTCILTDTMLDS